MSERYSYFQSEMTGLFVINDKKRNAIFSGIDEEYNCKKIVNLLNKKEDSISQLVTVNQGLVAVTKDLTEFNSFVKELMVKFDLKDLEDLKACIEHGNKFRSCV